MEEQMEVPMLLLSQSTIIQQSINPFFLFAFSKLSRVKIKIYTRKELKFSPATH